MTWCVIIYCLWQEHDFRMHGATSLLRVNCSHFILRSMGHPLRIVMSNLFLGICLFVLQLSDAICLCIDLRP